MIKVKIYRNKDFRICGFTVDGHAGFSEEGADIVCSAVSILVINTINSIEKFTKEEFSANADEKNGGHISCDFPQIKEGKHCHDAELLLEAMLNGLKSIEEEYGCYIKINDKGGKL